eukprot:SM000328S12471  [mRNA]  locus=s328:12431:16199:- [translate_table: standard]
MASSHLSHKRGSSARALAEVESVAAVAASTVPSCFSRDCDSPPQPLWTLSHDNGAPIELAMPATQSGCPPRIDTSPRPQGGHGSDARCTWWLLTQIGQGTYSSVYKARDLESQRLVALKKVRFDNLEPESVRFMAREIEVLRRLEHPNVVRLEGLVTSRMSCSLYLVFEYMEHDLAGLAACPGVMFTEAQVKCYMQQLLRGLEHCHAHGVLHRDIKGSNLLLDNHGCLKIADFGLATFYRPEANVPLTSRVVTLWYRPPELLLGATNYGAAVDLWSSGCILAELLAGKPIMPGRTEVEQLHKIFKLCGSPSEEYWRRSRLPHATIFKPQQPYKRCLADTFKDFPPTSLALLETLLAIEPNDRGTAAAALKSDFFTTKPFPCDPQSLPQYPPSKEYDAKLRDEEARRQRAAGARPSRVAEGGGRRQANAHRPSKAIPAPHANAELEQSIALQKQHMARHGGMGAGAKSKSEKFAAINEHSMVGFHGGPPPALPSSRGASPNAVPEPSVPLTLRERPLSSKSGPQPMLKPGGALWPRTGLHQGGPGGAGAPVGHHGHPHGGQGDDHDVRMAPPRSLTRPTKSVTARDSHAHKHRTEKDHGWDRERLRDMPEAVPEGPSAAPSHVHAAPAGAGVERCSEGERDRERDVDGPGPGPGSLPPPPWRSSQSASQPLRKSSGSIGDKRLADHKAWMLSTSTPVLPTRASASGDKALEHPSGAANGFTYGRDKRK